MGQNRKIYRKFKNPFFENVQDFIFGIYLVIFIFSIQFNVYFMPPWLIRQSTIQLIHNS